MLSGGAVKYMEQMSGWPSGKARVDLNSLSLHCPPVSAIQLYEVIIESDTNPLWVQFTVVFHHLESVTNQERTPFSKLE